MLSPAVLEDGFACGPDLMRNSEESPVVPIHERRRRARIPLSWTVHLVFGAGRRIESKTKNISSDGFYCLVPESVTAGDLIRCVIHVPAADPSRADQTLFLECETRVVRVEEFVDGTFGIGCSIEEYHVVPVCEAVENI
jgi:hypothetical protein